MKQEEPDIGIKTAQAIVKRGTVYTTEGEKHPGEIITLPVDEIERLSTIGVVAPV